MKKLLTIILSIVLIFAVACAEEPDVFERVSYLQTALLYGAEGNVRVTVKAGLKESTPSSDGACGSKEAFNVLTVRPITADKSVTEYGYYFKVGENEYSGALERDRFGHAYTANLPKELDASSITTVTVTEGETEYVVSLDNMMGDLIIDAEKALEIALSELGTELEAEEADGYEREIHIKFINDGNNPSSKYYWYVAFIRENAPYWALLIDPETGEVVAKRV